MKLPDFGYAAPRTADEAVALLAAGQGEARPLAGGQSLLPILAFRLGAPAMLVDLRHIEALRAIRLDDGALTIGAMVRWRDLEFSLPVRDACPIIPAAVSHIGHRQIRNRGTVGGSLAHADPAAEFSAVAMLCGATISVIGPSGSRTIGVEDLFDGPLSTTLEPDELIVDVSLPVWPARRRWAFQEFARRHGDFALAGAALCFDVDDAGRALDVRIVTFGSSQQPHRVSKAEKILEGSMLTRAALEDAAKTAGAAFDTEGQPEETTAYLTHLAATMVRRGLGAAVDLDIA